MTDDAAEKSKFKPGEVLKIRISQGTNTEDYKVAGIQTCDLISRVRDWDQEDIQRYFLENVGDATKKCELWIPRHRAPTLWFPTEGEWCSPKGNYREASGVLILKTPGHSRRDMAALFVEKNVEDDADIVASAEIVDTDRERFFYRVRKANVRGNTVVWGFDNV